jgi:hypothetical protein
VEATNIDVQVTDLSFSAGNAHFEYSTLAAGATGNVTCPSGNQGFYEASNGGAWEEVNGVLTAVVGDTEVLTLTYQSETCYQC